MVHPKSSCQPTSDRWATILVDSGLPANTNLDVSASISGSNCSDSKTQKTPVQPAPTPLLTLNKTASKTHINVGGQLVYTLKYKNTGSNHVLTTQSVSVKSLPAPTPAKPIPTIGFLAKMLLTLLLLASGGFGLKRRW